MGLTASIASALDAKLTDATNGLNVPVAKAWPSYDGSALVRPSAAVAWRAEEQLETPYPPRLGGGTKWRTEFDVGLFCQDEPRLHTYVDAARACMTGWHFDTIGGVAMDIKAGRIERIPQGETTIEALRYAAQWIIVFEYTR